MSARLNSFINEIMKNPIDIDHRKIERIFKDTECKNWREYNERCAQIAGFVDRAERLRDCGYETGRNFPKEINEDCPSHF